MDVFISPHLLVRCTVVSGRLFAEWSMIDQWTTSTCKDPEVVLITSLTWLFNMSCDVTRTSLRQCRRECAADRMDRWKESLRSRHKWFDWWAPTPIERLICRHSLESKSNETQLITHEVLKDWKKKRLVTSPLYWSSLNRKRIGKSEVRHSDSVEAMI